MVLDFLIIEIKQLVQEVTSHMECNVMEYTILVNWAPKCIVMVCYNNVQNSAII